MILTLLMSALLVIAQQQQQLPDNMVLVTGGTFIMGCQDGRDKDCFDSEKPAHSVLVGSFYIGKYEVTVREFKAFIEDAGYVTDADKEGWSYIWTGSEWEKKKVVNWRCDTKGNVRPESEYEYPVIHISWNDATEYCKWLSRKTGKNYRLPTEAEWEYAARGGEKSKGYLYSGSNTLADMGWNAHNSGGETHSVGSLGANELEIYDMSGNVWEWCDDDLHGDYKGAPDDGSAWVGNPRGSNRVLRGGGWFIDARNCRVTSRGSDGPDDRDSNLGFRLALSLQ